MTLVAEYGLNEGTGTTSVDTAGGHTLTINNATWATGHSGGGLRNTAQNQGAVATVPAITSPAITLMCWVNPVALSSGSTNFACGIMKDVGDTDIALFAQRGSFGTGNVLQADVRINGNLSACNGPSALTAGSWSHAAVTYDGSTIRLYKEGVQVATTSVTGTISMTTKLYIAGAISASGVDTNVVVDDVRLYDSVLTQSDISTAMNTPVGSGSGIPSVRYYNGSSWVNAGQQKYYNGSSWVNTAPRRIA